MNIENLKLITLPEQYHLFTFIQNNLKGRHIDVQQELLDKYTRNREFVVEVVSEDCYKVVV